MAFPTKYPPGFYSKIPGISEKPYGIFFNFVRQFLEQPFRYWRFSNPESVRLFNEELTKAIHKDVNAQKTILNHFRKQLEFMKKAFESLDKIILFFDEFDKFADECLSRTFQSTDFKEYVEIVTNLVTYYLQVKTRFTIFKGEVVWPRPDYHQVVILDPGKITLPMDKVINIDTRTASNLEMAVYGIRNFLIAIEIYTRLKDDLNPQFEKLIAWMGGSYCLSQFRHGFETFHEQFISQVNVQLEVYFNEIDLLENMARTNNWNEVQLKSAAEHSVRAVMNACQNVPKGVNREERMIMDVVMKVNNHALEVLKALHRLASLQMTENIAAEAHEERRKVAQITKEWINDVEMATWPWVGLPPLNDFIGNLPHLYAYLAHFIFKYCKPY